VLLDGQIPHKPRMPAVFHQHHLLRRCRQQSEPRHTSTVATATDNNGQSTAAYVGIGVPSRRQCRGCELKEAR
jgi:hypothetical protein